MEINSSLPHQIFSWKFYFYETKIILGRPALTLDLSLRIVAVVAVPAIVVELGLSKRDGLTPGFN